MAVRISRRKLAEYVADRLIAGDDSVISELAAYLIESRKLRELPLIVRDIETACLERGVVVADIYSAADFTAGIRHEIEAYIKASYDAKKVFLRHSIDPDLLGGVAIRTADSEKDATVRHAINNVRAMKL